MYKFNNGHFVDYDNKVIKVTQSFYKKACNILTDEFNVFKSLRNEFPDFKIEKRAIAKKDNKKSYRNLTYDNMKRYIAQEKNGLDVLIEFEKVKEKSYIQSSPYAYVKRWFLNQYPNYEDKREEPETTDNKTTTNENDEQAAA